MPGPEVILHHYPRSPFARKVGVALGLKKVHWRAVIQPRIAPKPALTPLTGGYRRIPVLQIGADIYCDTRCILAELERRFPEPCLYPPGTGGLADLIAAWADRELFANALGLVFGLNGDQFPAELHADRARFTAGRFDGWDSNRMKAMLPVLKAQFAIQLDWLERGLDHGRGFLLGQQPSLADLAAYHPLWYARGNLADAAGLAGHPRLLAWMARLDAIGCGTMVEMSPEEAIAIARAAEPANPSTPAPYDPDQSLPGGRYAIVPTDWGFDPVEGELVSAEADRISLRRYDPEAGTLVVHFPRRGFSLEPAAVRASARQSGS